MRPRRENCVILDTSTLPGRPSMQEIENFVMQQLRPDMSQVKCVQPHNVKNVVYVGMESSEAATIFATTHHLKHHMEFDGKKFPIPIYVESSAVDVRIHDLPFDMDNVVIIEHLRQYGEVIAIRNEVWKSYFPGLINGVRVARMRLNQPIPSFITVDDEPTLVTYPNQVRTCRNCSRKSHPKQSCSTAAAAAAAMDVKNDNTPRRNDTNNIDADKTQTASSASTPRSTQQSSNSEQWPALVEPKNSVVQQQKRNTEPKRQRSIDSDTNKGTKKANTNDSDESDSSLITVSSDICPYTQRPYAISDCLHIEDENERRALIEETKQRIDAGYRELMNNKKKNLRK